MKILFAPILLVTVQNYADLCGPENPQAQRLTVEPIKALISCYGTK